jgi:alpha-tubulin suppressor-like RCC1 family protein
MGARGPGAAGTPPPLVRRALATTRDGSFVITANGDLWSWGAPFESWTSPPPGTFASPTVVGKGYGQVAAGRAHSLALRRDGTLVGWGANVCGQLGHADPAPSHHPVTLARRIRHIAAGEHASYAIATDGTLWRWGTESTLCRPDRQAGPPVPPGFGKPEKLGTGFATITANGRAVLFLDRDGRWWEPDDRAGSPLRELAARDHAQIVRSSSTCFGLGRDGTLQAWGGETSYDHPAFSRTLDQRAQPGVPVPIGSGYSAIAISGEHALAIGQDGNLWAWGRNNRYQVGEEYGYWGPKAPVRIGTDVKAIAVADLQSFTIRADGTLLAWGDTTLGQLGIGRSMPFRPVRVLFPGAREAQASSSSVITGAAR